MKKIIKKFIKRTINNLIQFVAKTDFGRYVYEQIIEHMIDHSATVNYHGQKMLFSVPNRLCQYRIDTFATKEPETLEWLETLPESAVLWDVGANIGLYSVYAAKLKGCKVYSFEPSVFNMEMLARNIFYNDLQEDITIVPVALSDKKSISLFKMSSTKWGGALSTFAQDYDQNGELLNDIFEYSTIGISMIDAKDLLDIPQPQYIKIDVDGIEHLILGAGLDVLKSVESVLVEINDDFYEQASKSTQYLQDAGFTLYRKCDLGVPNQYNQWWIRKS